MKTISLIVNILALTFFFYTFSFTFTLSIIYLNTLARSSNRKGEESNLLLNPLGVRLVESNSNIGLTL